MNEEEKQNRLRLYDAFICLFLYLLCVSIPAIPGADQASFTGFMRFLCLALVVPILTAKGNSFPKSSFKNVLLCLPLLVFAFGNMSSLLLFGKATYDPESDLLRSGVFTVGTALLEEVVFRFGLNEAIKKTKYGIFSILIVSALFGLCHLLSILAGAAPLTALAQAGYTFLLGLFLGVAYEVGGLLPAFLLHFVFNFLQTDLYLALGGGNWDLPFFVCNGVCFLLAAAYGAFLFIRFIRRPKESV